MGMYIEGLDRPRNEYMRIHIDFDGEVWVFRGSEWKSLGIKATNLDLVRCKDCKHYDTESRSFPCCTDIFGAVRYMEADGFCSKGERRADENALGR